MNSIPSSTSRRPAQFSTPKQIGPLPVEQAFRNVLQRRNLIFASLFVSLLAGLVTMFAYTKKQHTYEGTLLYTPNSITAPYYTPPSLNNLVHLVDSPVVLEKLREEYALEDTLSDLDRNIKFELVPGGDTLVVRVTRSEPAEAAALLNTAMQLFVDETRELRKQTLQRFVMEFENDMSLGKQNVQAAAAELRDFLEGSGIDSPESLKDVASGMQEDVRDLDMELEMARIELASNLAKREKLVATREKQETYTKGDKMNVIPSTKSSSFTSHSDLRSFLRDQIVQEQQSSSYAVKLKVKEREQQRAKALHAERLISDAEMERIDGELSILQAEHTGRVESLQEQLKGVEQKLSQNFVNLSSLDPQQSGIVLAGFAEEPRLLSQSIALMELEILGAEHKVERLANKLAAKQANLQKFSQLNKQVQPLVESLRLAVEEHERLQNLLEEFRQSHRSDIDELKVVQSATPTIDGVRSNSAKIFAGTTLGLFVLLLTPSFFREWQKQASPTVERTARLLGLPVLSHADRQQQDSTELLAFRLRQMLPTENASLLFVSTSNSKPALSNPIAIAEAIARGGDSVVLVALVDEVLEKITNKLSPASRKTPSFAGVAAEEGVGTSERFNHVEPEERLSYSESVAQGSWSDDTNLGIADFLRGSAFDADQLIRPSTVPNLSYIASGTTPVTSDLLLGNKIHSLFDQLRTDFSLVVVAGPRLDQRLHVECMSKIVDGVVILCQGNKLEERDSEAIHNLVDANIPVLSFIT